VKHQSRETAFKIIYQLDVGKNEQEIALESTMENDGLNKTEQRFCRELVMAVQEHITEIDEIIQRNTTGWNLGRMMSVDRNLLRLAVYEMLFSAHIAQEGAINEAVELAKIYGQKKSPAFVNSILDKVLKREPRRDSRVTEAAQDIMAQSEERDPEEQVTMVIEREITAEEADALLAGQRGPIA